MMSTPAPHWLRGVYHIPLPDPDTIPTRAYSACDERSIQQQPVVDRRRQQWWNSSKTTKNKSIQMIHPPEILMIYRISSSDVDSKFLAYCMAHQERHLNNYWFLTWILADHLFNTIQKNPNSKETNSEHKRTNKVLFLNHISWSEKCRE